MFRQGAPPPSGDHLQIAPHHSVQEPVNQATNTIANEEPKSSMYPELHSLIPENLAEDSRGSPGYHLFLTHHGLQAGLQGMLHVIAVTRRLGQDATVPCMSVASKCKRVRNIATTGAHSNHSAPNSSYNRLKP
ncbi:hypothetical protein FBULB1_5229 [Fusarium bulbicola]|nr:hypothetical protein FBULB1_5229 [Fusarium bulbicola]